MTQYGPNSGVVPFTGFTPTLGITEASIPSASGGQVSFNGMTQEDDIIAKQLFSGMNRVTRRLLNALIGATSGGTATETRTRTTAVQANNDAFCYGGIIAVETINLINRATTAADITNLKAVINRVPYPASYPTDVSGVGGGGKAGW